MLKEIAINQISLGWQTERRTDAPRGTNFRKLSKGKVNSFCQAIEMFLYF